MNQVSEDTDKDAVRIVREMAATPAEVYGAFTDPDQLMRWMGPKRFHATEAKVDATIGGHALITVEADNGDRGTFDWEFVELVPAERIVISFAFDPSEAHRSRFTIDLKETGPNTTELTLVHDRLGQAPPGGHAGVNEGWNQAMDKLVDMFEKDQ
jgi:uncharacterized protein YndB with AHSA1/START domain